jgi:uncharacterized protein (DUF2249 family)
VDSGEDYDAAAGRELGEELGIILDYTPRRLFKIAACEETGQEFVWVYRLESEGPFTLHPVEIERGEWFAPGRVNDLIVQRPGDFASGFVLIWGRMNARPASGAGQVEKSKGPGFWPGPSD